MIRKFISRNPFSGKLIKEFDFVSQSELDQKLQKVAQGFERNSAWDHKEKVKKLERLSSLIDTHKTKYAELISTEMGKPINEAIGEVSKASSHCLYYAHNIDKLLKPEMVPTEAKKSIITYEPLGGVYVMVPFNFPFWLTFKPVIPYMLSGNSVLVRNSDSTPLTGLAIEELFQKAGFENFEYQNVLSSPEQLETIVGHSSVAGVSFCGSSRAGAAIASVAGKYLKKCVFELGGSDPFVVLADADIHLAVDLALKSRLTNAGQVCFSSKRFIIHERAYEHFRQELIHRLAKVQHGDPLNPDTQLGPLARNDLKDNLLVQMERGMSDGGVVAFKKDIYVKDANFFGPVVMEVKRDNCLFKEETFGPLFPLVKVKSEEEAIEIANDTPYGLGAVVVSRDLKNAEEVAEKIKAGMVFVNEVVKSDSRLPSGGIKLSGYGRECGRQGVKEFTNIKTTYIAHPPQNKKK